MPLARDASWEDVGADALGVICALAVFALFDRRSNQFGAGGASAHS